MQETNTPTSAPEEFVGYPELVLRELPDGRVTGVAMREMRSSFHVTFAGKFAEPEEVERGIEILRRLGQNDTYGTWKKELDIDSASLDDAIASSPESSVGQKFVFLYRGNEWVWGIWNNPDHPKRSEGLKHLAGVDLHSVADFHGTRVSAAKRDVRPGLDTVRANTTLAGSYQELEVAIDLLEQSSLRSSDKQDYETHPAVHYLCEWWNRNAPEGSREAGFVRLYVWNETDRIFNACDPEEPAAQADQLDSWPSYALFEHPGMPTVLGCFYRGRRFNKDDGTGGTKLYAADGSEAWDIGLEASEVDEAYYSLVGLERLAEHDVFAV
ncbi:hypothetical protein [Paraburkholderia fungorum]|uniref:Uncharacterized protein n=1 Tax=Paraburkholderia fungorum TaxID=134537 RepID=A0AAW3V1S6_9BURK|nr:hypothetical protein [Paraburkholderia fungorum]MBB4517258.1 hypothetical protein [Paraburkholderia fungorum]MBB6204326.1 hypothetical protein [Paraburkholderia fungorum]